MRAEGGGRPGLGRARARERVCMRRADGRGRRKWAATSCHSKQEPQDPLLAPPSAPSAEMAPFAGHPLPVGRLRIEASTGR